MYGREGDGVAELAFGGAKLGVQMSSACVANRVRGLCIGLLVAYCRVVRHQVPTASNNGKASAAGRTAGSAGAAWGVERELRMVRR